MAIITGTESPETLNGTPEGDTISGLGGNDTLNGGEGDDDLDGGDGDDALNGQAGNDIIRSLMGRDVISGGTGTDTLVLDWSSSNSGANNSGTGAAPSVNATEGGFNGRFNRGDLGDLNYTSIERFLITTGNGADNITTASGDDVVRTGGGDDIVNTGTGRDQADGGSNGDGSRGTDRISADLSGATGAIVWDLENNIYSGPEGTSFVNFELFGTVTTGSGNDILVTRDIFAAETINSGAGDDTITSRNGTDAINGGTGTDTLVLDWSASNGGASNTNIGAAPSANGTEGGFNGRFNRGDIGDVNYISIERFDIRTGGGSDNITTASGDDIVSTGGGNDFVNFGSGNDQGDGGAGEDGFSADLSSVSTALSIDLETGLSLSFANFEYIGVLTTGSGDDVVVTRDIYRAETINTGAGNDRVTSRNGQDVINGGTGTDTLVLDWSASNGSASNSGILAANGTQGGLDGRFNRGDIGDVVFTSIERFDIRTGGGSDNITTGGGDDRVSTGAGVDIINTGAGNDLLDGGIGQDTMTGGLGDDVYIVSQANDMLVENSNGGVDEVRTDLAAYTLGAELENLTGTGIAGQALTGNIGDNRIDGGLGADAMAGGLGNDTYVVDDTGDIVSEAAGEGVDGVETALGSRNDYSQLYLLSANVENLIGTSPADQGVWGNALDNVVTMGGGNDLVVLADRADLYSAAGGSDSVSGGGGDDFVFFGGGFGSGDSFDGGAGTDMLALLGDYTLTFDSDDLVSVEKLAVYTSADALAPNDYDLTMIDANLDLGESLFVTAFSLSANESLTFNGAAELDGGRFEILGGAGADSITGGAARDYLAGNGGADALIGGDGADLLFGGAGADSLQGGAGVDHYHYANVSDSTGGGFDVIHDFQVGGAERIGLAAIDADSNSAGVDDAFTFIGTNVDFGNVAGQLRVVETEGNWFVEGDTDGNGIADLVIQIGNGADLTFLGTDFIL